MLMRRKGRKGRTSGPVAAIEWLIEAFRTRYFDFTAKHFHAAVRGAAMTAGKFQRSSSWTKSLAMRAGSPARPRADFKTPVANDELWRRGAHRRKRARRPLPVFQDALPHAWLAEGPPIDLVVTMDDATRQILPIFLVAPEGKLAAGESHLKKAVARKGLDRLRRRPISPSLTTGVLADALRGRH